MSEAKENVNLSPEDQATFDAFVDPDEKTISFKLDETQERIVLGGLCQSVELLGEYVNHIKPSSFATKYRQRIATAIFEHYKVYGGLPSVPLLYSAVAKLSEPEDKLGHNIEIDLSINEVSLLAFGADYVRRHLDDHVARTRVQYALCDAVSALKKPDAQPKDILADTIKKLSAPQPQRHIGTELFSSWEKDCLIADTQQEDWVVDQWLEFGTLGLFTGLPFAGKSTITGQLVASIANGSDFFGRQVAQQPFVLLDFENRERALIGRIKNCLQDNPGRITELYHRIHPLNIPRPLTTEFIEATIRQLSVKIGATAEKGLVIIDTFRSAFVESEDFDELDVRCMVRLLKGLKDMAAKTGWAVLVLHHNAKASNQYSGSTAIAAVADFMWNWVVDKDKLVGTLSCEGRADYQSPLKLAYDISTKRNVLLGTQTEIKDKDRKAKEHDDIEKLLFACETALTEETGQSITGIQEVLCRGETHVTDLANLGVSKGLLVKSGKGKRNNPFIFHLTQAGQDALFAARIK